MSIKKQYIPAPLASAVKGGCVTDTSEILDDTLGKTQSEINAEIIARLEALENT